MGRVQHSHGLAKPNCRIYGNKIKNQERNRQTKNETKEPNQRGKKGPKKPLSTLNQFKISELFQKVRRKYFISETLACSQALLHSVKKNKFILFSSTCSFYPLKLGRCNNKKPEHACAYAVSRAVGRVRELLYSSLVWEPHCSYDDWERHLF